ncbi:MAG: hypothetical protein AAFO75_09820 [Pseudomonadota bacterium]
MIGWRGPLAAAIGGIFLLAGVNPLALGLGDDVPPDLLRWAIAIFGCVMASSGVWLMRFNWRRHWVVRHIRPVNCTIEVLAPKDGHDTTVYDARVVLMTGVWRMPVVARKAAEDAAGKGPSEGRVWVDPATKTPIAIEREGHWLETIPQTVREGRRHAEGMDRKAPITR